MDDTGKYRFRAARDLLIDQIVNPYALTLPLPDLPIFTDNPIVIHENGASIRVPFYQPDCTPGVRDSDGDQLKSVKVEDDMLNLVTKPLVDHEYNFVVTMRKSASGLSKNLLKTIAVKVTLDEDLQVAIHPELAEYGQPVSLILDRTQNNAIYQVFDDKGNALTDAQKSKDDVGMEFQTIPLYEDTVLVVHIENKRTGQTGTVRTQPLVRIYPNEAFLPQLQNEEAGTEYYDNGLILLPEYQESTDYKLLFVDIDDDTVDKETMKEVIGKQVKPEEAGGPLKLVSNKLKEDTTVSILAIKRDSKLERVLTAQVFIPVKPDPDKKLIQIGDATKAEGTVIRVKNPQRGVYYQLLDDQGKEVGWRCYYHKNYGLGKARVGIELAVDEMPDDSVYLATGPLKKTTTFSVIARKATTDKTNMLLATIAVTID